MPTSILMPALSPTMTEGNLVKWHKKEGDTIESGDVLAEIETDKATMEVEAVDEGTLGQIVIPEGSESVQVNAIIGYILDEGEDTSALKGVEATTSSDVPSKATPQAGTNETTPPSQNAEKRAPALENASKASGSEERIKASPLARRIAADKGVELKNIQGSGPRGRIVRADVENVSSPVQTSAGVPPVMEAGSYETQSLTGMRKVIAQRLTESKQTVPHFYLTVDCELDALLTLRKDLNNNLENEKISVNDFVIKATAQALKAVPESNASWGGDHIKLYNTADVSVAVAVEGGLWTPVVRACEQKTLRQISTEIKDLAGRARKGKLMPEEAQGGSCSVSNLGMYGIKDFKAIVNPPQGLILAVGAGEKRPVVRGDSLAVATVMTVTVSVDHRVVDGAVGSEFLQAFKKYIENPVLMMA